MGAIVTGIENTPICLEIGSGYKQLIIEGLYLSTALLLGWGGMVLIQLNTLSACISGSVHFLREGYGLAWVQAVALLLFCIKIFMLI